MRTPKIRWLGPERRRQLLEKLQGQVDLWSDEWSVSPGKFSFELLDSEYIDEASGWHWYVADCPSGTLHFGAPPEMLDLLGGVLAQIADRGSSGFGRRVAERALQSLAARLTGSASTRLLSGDMPSERERLARFGGLCGKLSGRDVEAILWLDSALCDVISPPQSRVRTPLQRRESSLGSEQISLDVVVDFGSATVADTRGLRIGEVLVSRTPLESQFHLVTPAGKSVGRGNPCRSGGSRALQIQSS